MKQWKHETLITLATLLTGWTVLVTWAALRISTFIIHNDAVWESMEANGYKLELTISVFVFHMGTVGLLPIVSVVATCCLAYFWVLYRKRNAQQIGAR